MRGLKRAPLSTPDSLFARHPPNAGWGATIAGCRDLPRASSRVAFDLDAAQAGIVRRTAFLLRKGCLRNAKGRATFSALRPPLLLHRFVAREARCALVNRSSVPRLDSSEPSI